MSVVWPATPSTGREPVQLYSFNRATTVRPPVDLTQLKLLVAGDEELARELFALLEAEIPVQAELLDDALRADDRAHIQRIAHRLKGSLLSVGAPEPAALAAQLEAGAVTSPLAHLQHLAGQLDQTLQDLMTQVKRLQLVPADLFGSPERTSL